MAEDLSTSHAPLAEISQGPSAFEQFLDRNQKNLVILAILLALGTAAFVVYQGIEKSRQETAGAEFCKADDLASLQKVIGDHAKTKAAQSAMVLLAERQWSDGQRDAAIETLRKFVSESPSHPAIPTARASLGAKLMMQGKTGEASAAFEEVANDPNARYIAPFALISIGDMAKLAGDLEKAEASYNRVKTSFPESSFSETATRRISSLKAKAPVEIAPPPKPEVKPEDKSADLPLDPTAGQGSQLPPGITVTPVDPDAPATDISPATPAENPPVQETPPANGSGNNPEEKPATPEP